MREIGWTDKKNVDSLRCRNRISVLDGYRRFDLHHGEQIRDAVGAPSADDPVVMGPVLATFAFSLPESFRLVDAPDGTHVVLVVQGAAGGAWTVRREGRAWRLYSGAADVGAATVTLAQDDAWRMYTRVLARAEVERRARIEGDTVLAQRILSSVAIIA